MSSTASIEKLPHHEQQELCTTRPLYRQGKKLTAVKVYSIVNESAHLLISGVPSLKLLEELRRTVVKYGNILHISCVQDYANEPFTETYHVLYARIQSARYAKKQLDGLSFFGGVLHVFYAPELESIAQIRAKLRQRKRDVAIRIRRNAESTKAGQIVPAEPSIVPAEPSFSGEEQIGINSIIGPTLPADFNLSGQILPGGSTTSERIIRSISSQAVPVEPSTSKTSHFKPTTNQSLPGRITFQPRFQPTVLLKKALKRKASVQQPVVVQLQPSTSSADSGRTTLARWRAAQLEDHKRKPDRRPYLASECRDLRRCEKWRMQVIREIAKKVAQIQNAGLGEFRIRDLNDEINKLLREKGHWEAQIKELGGPDYAKTGPRMLDHEGKEVPGNRGYKYFGAAKDLPGVRELFEQEPPPPPRKTRGELMKDIDADYYGYRDDDDGILIPREQEEERKAITQAVDEWKKKKEAVMEGRETEKEAESEEEEDIYATAPDVDSDEESARTAAEGASGISEIARFIAHVPVPSQQEVEAALLRRKKQELMEKYASDDLISQDKESKSMLGIN